MSYEWPTYQIELPMGFDVPLFIRAVEGKHKKLWLIKLDDEPGIIRLKGVVLGDNVRVFVDIISPHQKDHNRMRYMFVTTPWYQNLSAKEVTKIISEIVGSDTIYHEGERVYL